MDLFLEDPVYLREQLITCLGNKRALLDFVGTAVDRARALLGTDRPRIWDAFGGSGVVSRYLKRVAASLVFSDLEPYATVSARCYLTNAADVDLAALRTAHARVNAAWTDGPRTPGVIATHYAPADDAHIRRGERVFYTRENALRIDTYRGAIAREDPALQPYLLGPLLSEASVHANTAGVFKGFYKNRETGVGQFGGTGADALVRIRGAITLPLPVWSRFARPVTVLQGDANTLARTLPEVDLAYLDPPYNQHPYGSNYFMLNVIAEGDEPRAMSAVSGIPADWRRSAYNSRTQCADALAELIRVTPARALLVSYNSEGFLPAEALHGMLGALGPVEVFAQPYNTFRGSRNLRDRHLQVTEYLYLVVRR